MTETDFPLRGDHIPLDALLKATGLAPSGGAAKAMVAAGLVQVDGAPESRKTAKLRAGQRVAVGDARIRLTGSDTGTGNATVATTAGEAAVESVAVAAPAGGGAADPAAAADPGAATAAAGLPPDA